MSMMPETLVRTIQSQDINFIYNSWLKSYGDSADVRKKSYVYYQRQKKVISNLMGVSNVLLLVNPEDESQIYGYMVYQVIGERFILHWLYVKYTYRRLGLATHLISGVMQTLGLMPPIVVTHRGPNWEELQHKIECIYQPKLQDA